MSDISSLSELITSLSNNVDYFGSELIKSSVPEKCLQEPCILGVDEAGRGPVLGPMVYAVFFCCTKYKENLKEIGCADSKSLNEKKREDVFSRIAANSDNLGWIVDVISPNAISNGMLKRNKKSLNEIAAESTLKLIEKVLEEKVLVEAMYVDTLGPPEKYQEKLSKLFPHIKVTVSKKADSLYPVVGGASICAKVVRDKIVQLWKFPELITNRNVEYGTGYPADPQTEKFLSQQKDDLFGFPNIVRFSWSTATKVLETSSTVNWESENEDNSQNTMNLTSYFTRLPVVESHKSQSSFFKNRNLSAVDSF